MLAFFIKGGPIMLVLLFCSIAATYIISYKFIFLRLNFKSQQKRSMRLKKTLLMHGKRYSLSQLNKEDTIPSRLFAAAIRLSDWPKAESKEGMQKSVYSEMPEVESMLPILSGIITIMPMLGLTGTIIGLMDIFSVLSDKGLESPDVLSAGISTALITTVTSLVLSLPLIIIYKILKQHIRQQLLIAEQLSLDVMTFCKFRSGIRQ